MSEGLISLKMILVGVKVTLEMVGMHPCNHWLKLSFLVKNWVVLTLGVYVER